MREVANRCDDVIDEHSVNQYTIQGIQGVPTDKIIFTVENIIPTLTKNLGLMKLSLILHAETHQTRRTFAI